MELFEREATALRQLEHPAIPGFVDAFEDDEDGAPRFYIVQSLVDGTPLSELIADQPGDFRDAEELAAMVLEVLAYLQSFTPPVIHRDIKPENLLKDASGRFPLVDFGAVTLRMHGTTGGSTVVGTSGYMAPEQLLGRACAASDLYGLGATLVHFVTGVHPADLPIVDLRMQWRDRAQVPANFAA